MILWGLHDSPDTFASRVGSFWELGLWKPYSVCVIGAAMTLKSRRFSPSLSRSWAQRKGDPRVR